MKSLFQVVNKEFTSKEDIYKVCCQPLIDQKIVTEKYYPSVIERGKMASFFMGNGLIIPHSTEDGRKEINGDGALLTTWFTKPVLFDNNTVHFAITIAVGAGSHMDALEKIAMLFMDEDKVKEIVATQDIDQIKAYLTYE